MRRESQPPSDIVAVGATVTAFVFSRTHRSVRRHARATLVSRFFPKVRCSALPGFGFWCLARRLAAGALPADRHVERLRVEAARQLLEESASEYGDMARRCGFGSVNSMRRSVLRVLKVAPSDYRKRFRVER